MDAAYAFDTTPPPPLYAAGTGSGNMLQAADGVEKAFATMNPNLKL